MTVTSLSFSSSSRARFHPTLPAPAMITYTRGPPSGAAPRRSGRRRRPARTHDREPPSGPFLARPADGRLGLAERCPLEHVDGDRRRADGLEPLLGVPGGTPRVED